jgi:hypothetical protein
MSTSGTSESEAARRGKFNNRKAAAFLSALLNQKTAVAGDAG